jgi:DMSO reductase anchor subunit
MHPALSVILFTTLSGAGYGVLILVGLHATSMPDTVQRPTSAAAVALALAMVAGGLLASFWHLGHPERAWRAFSQWQSSWLSREAVASALSFVPALALAWLLWRGGEARALRAAGAATLLGAVVTLYCTAWIYRSLKAIPAWHNGYVVPGYLLLALATGALWFWLVVALGGGSMPARALAFTAAFVAGAGLHKALYWRALPRMAFPATRESALGIAGLGHATPFEAPHTEESYLTREMGFRVARKHASRLRAIAAVLCLAVLAALALAWRWPETGALWAPPAVLAASAAVFVERWLFFAEARHVVTLYYDRAPA